MDYPLRNVSVRNFNVLEVILRRHDPIEQHVSSSVLSYFTARDVLVLSQKS